MTDQFDLERFVRAQDTAGTYEQALAEIRRGRKVSHWMWFVFPQFAGLGRSAMAQQYAIGSRAEAAAYLAHPVLGPRLVAAAQAAYAIERPNAEQVFGGIDALKFRSSMTLFSRIEGADPVFGQTLEKYFGGHPDRATIELLSSATA